MLEHRSKSPVVPRKPLKRQGSGYILNSEGDNDLSDSNIKHIFKNRKASPKDVQNKSPLFKTEEPFERRIIMTSDRDIDSLVHSMRSTIKDAEVNSDSFT